MHVLNTMRFLFLIARSRPKRQHTWTNWSR